VFGNRYFGPYFFGDRYYGEGIETAGTIEPGVASVVYIGYAPHFTGGSTIGLSGSRDLSLPRRGVISVLHVTR